MTTRSDLLRILRHALAAGKPVEIEGLGSFHATPSGTRFEPDSRPQVFVAYAVEDLKQVRRLAKALRAAGCAPWLDKEKLIPGQNWPRAIERAIQTSDAFLACFSPRSVAKRGQFQSELRYALDCASHLPLDDVYLIPVRTEECRVPARVQREFQYVDLFPDWDKGFHRILAVMRQQLRARGRRAAA